jgi:hypothetical protein
VHLARALEQLDFTAARNQILRYVSMTLGWNDKFQPHHRFKQEGLRVAQRCPGGERGRRAKRGRIRIEVMVRAVAKINAAFRESFATYVQLRIPS